MSDSGTATAVRVDDDMQLDSPRPVVDVIMKEHSVAPIVHAPPSPAPSGDSQQHTSRPSPSPVFHNTAADPETSIPSPASPSGSASLPVEVDVAESPSAVSPAKHEHDYDAAMDDEADQRPAKRARTADVVSVSFLSSFTFSATRALEIGSRERAVVVDIAVCLPFLYCTSSSDGASFSCTLSMLASGAVCFPIKYHRRPSNKSSLPLILLPRPLSQLLSPLNPNPSAATPLLPLTLLSPQPNSSLLRAP